MKTKVLKKYQISSYLLELIDKAEEKVVLITPYVNVWGHLTQTIESALKRKVRIELYYRYYEMDNKTSVDYELDKSLGKLESKGVHCYEVKNLHTKLYLSEKSAIMTSMNLYEHSSKENEEIGLYTEDEELVKDFHSNYKDLQSRSEENKLDIKGLYFSNSPINVRLIFLCKELSRCSIKKIPCQVPRFIFLLLIGIINEV